MKQHTNEKGRISNHSQAVGTVTWDMVRKRAREIATINGRSPGEVLDSDFDQARRELTTLEEEPANEQILDSVPESERWNPEGGSTGKQILRQPLEDEEPQTERLVEEGIEDAEHDQMVQGAKEQAKKDRE